MKKELIEGLKVAEERVASLARKQTAMQTRLDEATRALASAGVDENDIETLVQTQGEARAVLAAIDGPLRMRRAESQAAQAAYAEARLPEVLAERNEEFNAMVESVRAALAPFGKDAAKIVALEEELSTLSAPTQQRRSDFYGPAGVIAAACALAVTGSGDGCVDAVFTSSFCVTTPIGLPGIEPGRFYNDGTKIRLPLVTAKTLERDGRLALR